MALDLSTEKEGNGKAKGFVMNHTLAGKKLLCRVWSDTGENTTPQVLAKKKITYGQPTFAVKIGSKKRYFKVNYTTKGVIKQDGKLLIFDTHFSNTIGALSFYEFPEAIDSDIAYTVARDNAVDMYVKKGGIPMLYLLIAMAVAMVAFIAIIVVLPPALQAQEQLKELDKQVSVLKQENANLRSLIPPTANGG